MLFLFSLIAFYNHNILRLKSGSDDGFSCILGYLDKLLNEGINNKEIQNCLPANNTFVEDYSSLINSISNEYLTLPEPLFEENISEYFDLKQSLLATFPNISFLNENKEIFSSIRPIIADLGPDLCQVISIDYNTLIKLYDYVLINKEEDGIQFGKLFDILQVSSGWVPKVAQILSFIDPHNEPLEVLMDGANIKVEYSKFNKLVKSLHIPQDDKERYLSFIKLIDIFSSGVDILSGVYHNFVVKYINEFIVPLIKTYIIKPVNIFDKSIYERAISLINALVKLQKYPTMCDKPRDELSELEQQKCHAFEMIIGFIAQQFPYALDEDGENATQVSLEKITEQVSIFTQEDVNLTSILIDNFTISENYVKFVFGSIANLTDTNKSYVDLLEGTNLIYNETNDQENEDFELFRIFRRNKDYIDGDEDNGIDYSNIPYQKYINNLTQIIKFISNLDDESNFKALFEYLGISEYWDTFSFIMEQVNRDNTICDNLLLDYLKIDNQTCLDLVSAIKKMGEIFTTTKQILSLVNQPTRFILDCIAPLLQELNVRISLFFNLLHKLLLAPLLREFAEINFPKKCDYTNAIKSSGNLMTKFFTLLDDITPVLLKKIPFIGDLISKVLTKTIEFLSLIRDNVDLATFFEFFMGGSSVITKMLQNAGKAYTNNDRITGEELAKSMQPTSFLNVYETANQINKIENMRFKNLANSITYDGSSSAELLEETKLTFNDVLPFKSIVQNSNNLSRSFKQNKLNLNLVAESFGTGEDNVKQTLNSVVKTALSPPADAIMASSVSSGYDINTVMAYLDGVGLFSKQVSSGELVKTKTNEYIKVKKSKGLSLGAIIGIAVASVVVVGVAVFLGVYFGVIRKRKQNNAVNDDSTTAAEQKGGIVSTKTLL